MSKNVIVIGGPTASGKSRLAIDLAKELNGVIINADASQVYQGVRVISAAPSPSDRAEADHRLYEYLDVAVNGNVCMWLTEAVRTVREVWSEGKTPIVVGGGGLYLNNLINGTTPIPEVSPQVRAEVAADLEQNGVNGLYRRLSAEDPAAAAMLNPNDTTRIRRACEIWRSTGKSIAEWYNVPMVKKLPEADFLTVVLLPPKKELDIRCNFRFDQMFVHGALDEVRYLISRNLPLNLPVMHAKGVPELIAAVEGAVPVEEAVELAKTHTRQYAKRQLTWFRNKMKADIVFTECYGGQRDFINDVKKRL